MKQATDLKKNDLALLIVGDPGSRKTSLALQLPKPYVFDADRNIAAPMAFLSKAHPNLPAGVMFNYSTEKDDGTPVPRVDRYKHMIESFNIAAASPDVETVVGDSLTAIMEIIIFECKRQANPNFNEEQLDKFTMRIQDWGTFGGLTMRMIMGLRASGKNVVFTAHNKVEKDESDGRYKYFFNYPGQSATSVPGLFTDVLNPYPKISGIGQAQTHQWMIRCLPNNDVDHRGIKSSLGFKVVETYDDVVKKLQTYKQP